MSSSTTPRRYEFNPAMARSILQWTINMRRWISISFFATVLAWGMAFGADALAGRLGDDEQAIQVGVGAFNDGFYDVAERQFSSFLVDFPNHERVQEVSYLLGRSFFLRGKFKEARAVFSKIASEGKNFEQMDFALFWGALTEIRLSSGESARRLLSHLVRRFPKFEWIDHSYYLLGILDLSVNNLSEAESSLRKTSQLSRRKELTQAASFWLGLLSYRQGDYGTAAGYFRAVSEETPAPSNEYARQALFWLGETQIRLGRFNEARLTYRTYCDRVKGDGLGPEVFWQLGFCEYRLGNLKESAEIFQRLESQLKDSKLLPYTHYLLGEIFLEMGDFPASVKEWTSLLGRPSAVLGGASLLSLYWNCIHLGDTDEANKTFQRLLKLTSYEDEKLYAQWLSAELTFTEGKISDALPYYFNIINSRFREKALFQIGRGYFFENKFREAMTNLDILLLEFPNSKYSGEGLFIKAEGWISLGNPDHAFQIFDLLVQRKREDLWQLLGALEMATLHLVRNEDILAEKILRDFVDRCPRQPLCDQALYQLGNISFRRKNVAEAIQDYSLALKGKASSLLGETYFRLGEAFYEQGKYDKAFSGFEYAIRHLPENSPWFFLAQLEMANLQKRWGRSEEARKAYAIILERSKDEALKKAAKELLSHVDSR